MSFEFIESVEDVEDFRPIFSIIFISPFGVESSGVSFVNSFFKVFIVFKDSCKISSQLYLDKSSLFREINSVWIKLFIKSSLTFLFIKLSSIFFFKYH